MADKCREVEYTSGASCNEKMTREKSVLCKEGSKVRANVGRIKDWARKSQADPMWLKLD